MSAVLSLFSKTAFMVIVYAMPILGMWAASSLATYLNGPRWVPIAAGLLAFPVLPLAWELLAQRRRRRKEDQRPRILTFADRITLRTFVLNLLFLGILLSAYPVQLFTSLSTRGDWFLEGRTGTPAARARQLVFLCAEQLEWLYEWTHDNPFADDDEGEAPDRADKPSNTGKPSRSDEQTRQAKARGDVGTDKVAQQHKASDSASQGGTTGTRAARAPTEPQWPLATEPHAALPSIPQSAMASPEAVGAYLRGKESNPALLVKAVHDFVALHVDYDAPALASGRYPPQDAQTVFRTGRGVCAGYSKLMVSVGKAAGLEIRYVVGRSRDMGGNVDGAGHAWNAVRIADRWYLIDVTWDSGYVNDGKFTKRYSSDYLLTPPKIFGLNHYPDEPQWQLREHPISRGEFIRQPNLRPGFYAMGFELLSPDRSQVTVDGAFAAMLANRRGQSVLATFQRKTGGRDQHCDVTLANQTHVHCDLPGQGTYHVQLFANEQRVGVHSFVGQFEVNSGS